MLNEIVETHGPPIVYTTLPLSIPSYEKCANVSRMARSRRQPAVGEDGLEFSDRLRLVMDRAGVPDSGQSLATYLDLGRQTTNKWLRGEAVPEVLLMFEIASRFRVDPLWLALGKGDMLKRQENIDDTDAAAVELSRDFGDLKDYRRRWMAFGRGLLQAHGSQPRPRVAHEERPIRQKLPKRATRA